MRTFSHFILLFFTISCADSNQVGLSQSQTLMPQSFSTQKYSNKVIGDHYFKLLSQLMDTAQKLQKEEDLNQQKDLVKKALVEFQRMAPYKYLGRLGQIQGEAYLYSEVYSGAFSTQPCSLMEKVFSGESLNTTAALNNLEILAFGLPNDYTCSDFSLTETDVSQAIKNQSQRLQNLLEPDYQQLKQYANGEGDLSSFISRDPLQDVYEVLTLYIDRSIKDGKLGASSGQHPNQTFPGQSCPECTELYLSETSYEALSENFKTLYFVFTQNHDFESEINQGLYQYLTINNYQDLAINIKDLLISGYELSKASIGQNMKKDSSDINNSEMQSKCENESSDRPALCELYSISKKLSDLVKNDLKVAMSLSTVVHGAGDGD